MQYKSELLYKTKPKDPIIAANGMVLSQRQYKADGYLYVFIQRYSSASANGVNTVNNPGNRLNSIPDS